MLSYQCSWVHPPRINPSLYTEPQPLLPFEDIILPPMNPLPCYLLLPITQDLSGLKNKNHPLATSPASFTATFLDRSACAHHHISSSLIQSLERTLQVATSNFISFPIPSSGSWQQSAPLLQLFLSSPSSTPELWLNSLSPTCLSSSFPAHLPLLVPTLGMSFSSLKVLALGLSPHL